MQFIGGAWLEAAEGAMRDIRNPATLERLGAVRDCGEVHVARAVAAARAALPPWRQIRSTTRGALLEEVAARIQACKSDLGALASGESGVPLCESRDCIEATAFMFERWGALARSGAVGLGTGFVGALLPQHFPLLALGAAAAPTLACGGTVVLLAPPGNPLASLALGQAFEGLPPGALNLIAGGAEAARALVGQAPAARELFSGPATADAFIVARDADLELTVRSIVWERLRNGGQIFASARPIFIDRSIAVEFSERVHQCVGFLDVDDPLKRPTDLGPLISGDAAERVEDQVGRALRAGARLILGGRRFKPSGLPGHFFQPTLMMFREGTPAPEAISGPVITMTPVRDLADGMRLAAASATDWGASIYTRDVAAAGALAHRHAGRLRINDPAHPGAAGPFGGLRQRLIRAALDASAQARSAQPREPLEAGGAACGIERAACRIESVSSGVEAAPAMEPKPWWFPYVNRVDSSRGILPQERASPIAR